MQRLTEEQKKMVEENFYLATWYVNRGMHVWGRFHRISKEDLDQAAQLGLMRAAVGWDPEKGRFSTYAFCCMRSYVAREFSIGASPVTVPANFDGKFMERSPECREKYRCAMRVTSLDASPSKLRNSRRPRFIKDLVTLKNGDVYRKERDDNTMIPTALEEEEYDILKRACHDALSEHRKLRRVFKLKMKGMTYTNIGKLFGVSKQQASNYYNSAVKKIKAEVFS